MVNFFANFAVKVFHPSTRQNFDSQGPTNDTRVNGRTQANTLSAGLIVKS